MAKLNLDRVRKNRDDRKARDAKGNGGYWKCGPGVNRVRLVLFQSSVTGNEEYCREFKYHQEQGGQPTICGKSPDRFGNESDECPECDRAKAVYEDEGKDGAKGMWARDRTAFLIVPLEKASKPFKNPKLYPFWAAKSVAAAIDGILADCDEVADVRDYFGPEGLDFKITFNPKASPMEMYQTKVMPKVKSESLDPAIFADAPEKDLYRDDSLEPVGWVDPGTTPPPVGGGSADDGASEEAETPAPSKKKAPKPKKKAAASDRPPEPGTPNEDSGNYDEANAQQYLAYYGFEGYTLTDPEDDPDGEVCFINPEGDMAWEAPTPTPEQEAQARGMTPNKRQPNPPAEDGEDDAGE